MEFVAALAVGIPMYSCAWVGATRMSDCWEKAADTHLAVRPAILQCPAKNPPGRHRPLCYSALSWHRLITSQEGLWHDSLPPIKTLIACLSVSPDRRWILYSRDEQFDSDLMLVENFR